MSKGPSHWGRLSPKRNKKSKLGRLTSISETPPVFLAPLHKQYEKVVAIKNVFDPETRLTRRKRFETYRLDERGDRIEKLPKEWAFGAWDIESHCYEHACSEQHRGCQIGPTGPKKCRECEACPACNPEHGEHWIAAQLSILRIPDQYIEYIASVDESQLFGGTRVEGGRYIEFLNGGRSLAIAERARCIAPDGCIDRTMRFLMAHPCFFQKARVSKGYTVKHQHTLKCQIKQKLDEINLCPGCLKQPYAPGVHTSKCRFERGFRKKDGTPCEGCSTISTAWYSHFGGGYDINFALRWLSEHSQDSMAAKQVLFAAVDDEEKTHLKDVFEARYQYKAESLLAGAAHIQVKMSKLIEVYNKPKPTKRQLAAIFPRAEGPGTKDYWLKGWLSKNLFPGGDLCSAREAQETLNLIMRSKLRVSGMWNERTKKAVADFQKKCSLPPKGSMDRETSAALRYLRSQTSREPDPNQVILLRDSFRLVGSRLETAAKDFDLKHPITGEKLTKIEDIDVKNPPPPDDADYRRYCRIDTEICVQLVTTFNRLIQELGGTLEMTASSCAVSLFRRRYLSDKILRHRHFPGCRLLCPSCETESCSHECGTSVGLPAGQNLERHQKLLGRHKKTMYRLCPTYPVGCFHFTALSKNGHRHGGHVDVLHQKLEGGRCYDVNSLYPFAMLGPVPTGPMQHYINLTPIEQRKLKPGSALGIASEAWTKQRDRVLQRPEYKDLVEHHGLDFAALEALFRLGADRGPDLETGEPFEDPNFDKVDSFKRIRQCGYVEAIVSIPQNDSIPESYFPPLPVVRDSKAGEILFWPVGDGIYGWWCYEELRALLEVPGAKLVALRQSVWFRGELIFKEFIETLYAKRRSSDGAMKQLLKILMNSTYGKTLQNPLKRRVLRLQSTQERPAGWIPTNPNPPGGDDFAWPWGTLQEYREAPFFLPQWGSLITARARTVIWRICVDVERGKYGRGKKVAYLDSVTGDRTVILQSPDKRTEIVPIAEFWNEFSDQSNAIRGKEFVVPKGWMALASDIPGKQGWFPIEKIVRHKVDKTIWTVTNKDGQTSVTEDHGIMICTQGGEYMAAGPAQFVKQGANFIKLKAPRSERVGERIDIMEFLSSFRHPGAGRADLHFEAEGEYVRLAGWHRMGRWSHLDADRASNDAIHEKVYGKVRFKRYFDPGSPELGALLRLLGAFISEGSASFPDNGRWMFTISQKNRPWLEDLQRDLATIATGIKAPILATSQPGGGMFAIRSGAAHLPCFFAALAGKGSAKKRLPSFVFDLEKADLHALWDKLREGDGSTHPITGQENYTTKSPVLTAGVSYLWDLLDLEHTVYFRPKKSTWSLFTRPNGSGRARKKTTVQTRSARSEWVYDLQVGGAHTFVDGIGRVLLHNTDSCYTNAELPEDSKKLGMLKLEYILTGAERQKHFEEVEAAWVKYQRDHEAIVAACEADASDSSEQKKMKDRSTQGAPALLQTQALRVGKRCIQVPEPEARRPHHVRVPRTEALPRDGPYNRH